ncbi:major urinary protein 11-like isoform 2-T2 [Liasis olivaceus]
MKVCLFALGLSLCCAVQTEWRPVASSDMNKITGVWYPLASIFNGELSRFDFYPFKFEAEENGKLVLSFNIPGEGTCRTQRYSLTLPGQPGDYRSKVPSAFRFVETDYDTYLIVHSQREAASYMVLAGRNPVLTDDLKQRFQTLADSLGFPGNVEPADLKGNSLALWNCPF